jgi:hypothetical protein
MDDNIKALLAKLWKNEAVDLEPGTHYVDEVLTVHVSGTVIKQNDAMVAPTTSLPLIPILALFWQRLGATREHAMEALRESLITAIQDGADKDEQIKSNIKDCEAAVKAIKEDFLGKLPKVKRSGRVVTKDLQVEVLPVEEEVLEPAAA